MRASLNQRLKDAFKHGFSALKHFVIPESNHSKPATREIPRALQIFDHRLGMLTAIKLDDQSRSNANEIHNVSSNPHLSPKPKATQAPMSQVVPETPLGVR